MVTTWTIFGEHGPCKLESKKGSEYLSTKNIKIVIIMSWMLEKTSISTVDTLETVVAETDVKNMSKSLGLNQEVLGFETIKAR